MTGKVELESLSSQFGEALSDKLTEYPRSGIISIAVGSEILALLALESVRVTVSLVSARVSARTPTVKVVVVAPAAMVNEPLVAV